MLNEALQNIHDAVLAAKQAGMSEVTFDREIVSKVSPNAQILYWEFWFQVDGLPSDTDGVDKNVQREVEGR